MEEEKVNNQSAESRWLCAATESLLKRLRRAFGQFTGAPASNNDGSVQVGICGVPAGPAEKFGLRRTVQFIDMRTSGTFTRGVTRIYLDQWDARNSGLVGQEGSELRECPRVQYRSLIPSSPDPRANASQFFDGNSTICASGGFNDVLCNAVVRVCGETGLLARQLLQLSFCAATAILLQFGAQAAMTVPNAFDGGSAVSFPIARGGNLSDAEVYTEEGFNIGRFRLIDVANRPEVEKRTAQNQVALALSGLQHFELPVPCLKRDLQATGNGPDRDGLRLYVPRQNTVIVSNRTELPERTLALLVDFVGIADFPDAPYHHLRRQPVLRLRSGIADLVQCELTESFRLPGPFADPVATGIRRLHRVDERGEGFGRGNQLYFGGEFHYTSSIETKKAKSNPAESRRYPPQELI